MRGLGHGCGNLSPDLSHILAVVRCWASFLTPLNLTFLKWRQYSIYRVSGLRKGSWTRCLGRRRGPGGACDLMVEAAAGSHSGEHSVKTRAPSSSGHSTRTVFRRSPARPPAPHRRTSPPAMVTFRWLPERSFSHHL